MSIHVKLNHVTHYRYDRPVSLSPQVVRLRPAPHCRTPVLAYALKVEPAGHFINWQQDPQSNYLARLVFPDQTTELRIEVDLVAELSVINPFDFFLEPAAEKIPFAYDAALGVELAPYLAKAPAPALGPKFLDYLESIPRTPKASVDFLVALNQRLQHDIRYLVRLEPGVQTPEETLALASGSCRDSAWLLVQLLRHLGLAARFVSGYLIQLVPDVKSLDGPSGTELDFTDLHAWCEVYLPGAGWVGLDPTSGLFAGEGHIPLACTPEPSSAAPITGFSDECECEFEHRMTVERVWEAPRVTKPYSDEQWAAIEALGHRIDGDLDAHDVRLTQGGEPTFVSLDDRDGAAWSSAALDPQDRDTSKPSKRTLAENLMFRLKDRYAPHGLLHFGQGKWYPGEQLPRWSLNCYWRRDGEPIWRDPELFARELSGTAVDEASAGRFLARVGERLGVDTRWMMAAFEDAWYYLWRERRLPANVDPHDSRVDDACERARLAKVFEQGLKQVVGHVLPIARSPAAGSSARWQSGSWFLRSERLYLIPGDSPIGYRLPLDSQPWADKGDHPWIHAADPNQAFPALPAHAELRQQLRPGTAGSAAVEAARSIDGTRSDPTRRPAALESAAWITRSALCAEPRGGLLYVFMPPTAALEDYLEVVAAVEAAAAEFAIPVVLEGYEPPPDPRLQHFRITPDPGVVEVNIHPAASWDELVERTGTLYDEAHASRLSTEKFLLDGRHTGTGGGNHFVLGGATPADSPFLRRPDLLRSLVSYWHNHPSLSYLFSGMFIGPTSQAPRVDEARHDSVHELELAFEQFPEAGKQVPPWLIDRLLRNLLIDATGNTHRAEFCIDKLYSPDTATGRLGLLELRAFEMPPHARMSLAQQLLLRALIARFWQQPYAPARLRRWGTELHDRFLLPHWVAEDFRDVVGELNEFGYPIAFDWFAPHFEFRFPKYGAFAARGVHVELRMALEPWHVMGEEGAPGGTVRYVDSSVERVQVKVSGLNDDRHVLTCNGRAVPLQPTGRVGEFVAGVRYRAWQPPSCLHPTIGVHAPLVFDLVDGWMQRSMGGCVYHVAHPGGRSHETYPVNPYEAEGRRLARFTTTGHTPGRIAPAAPVRNAEFPFTLDLRRQG
ncbi:transglutaminase family protein [Thauera sp.]|uniref:transglutaminase family protein n=1 Tax=Thauera sp. TaxID=1905334 RepID=UPI002633626D|nr:transglutaminase family protein [Thauera sp.]